MVGDSGPWTSGVLEWEYEDMKVVRYMRSSALLVLFCGVGGAQVFRDDAAAVHELIKPGAGEALWMDIPWFTSVWEARKAAARDGKPLFIWAGSGGGPIGVC